MHVPAYQKKSYVITESCVILVPVIFQSRVRVLKYIRMKSIKG